MLNGWWGSSDRNKYIADKRKDCRSAIKNTKSLQQAFYCCCLCMYRSPWLVCCWCRCRKKCNSFFECRSRFKSDYLLVKFYLRSTMNWYFISNRIILTNLLTYDSIHVKYYLLSRYLVPRKMSNQKISLMQQMHRHEILFVVKLSSKHFIDESSEFVASCLSRLEYIIEWCNRNSFLWVTCHS